MLSYLLLIFAIVHIILCVIIYLCVRSRVFGFSEQLMPMICLVPAAGIICAVIAEYMSRTNKCGTRNITLEEMHLQDDDVRLKNLVPDEDEGVVIPLEEAMSVNDSATRRMLMLDILRRSPEQYTELLHKACTADDIEVSHYASTAVMELQREYEFDLQKTENQYKKDESDSVARTQYIASLKRYIGSRLIDENILFVYRNRLAEVLDKKIQDEPEDMETLLDAVENYIALKNYNKSAELADTAVKKWPNREIVWLTMLNVYEQMNDGNGIKEVIYQMKKRNIYLSNHGKSVLAFWDKSGQTED